MPQRRRSTLPTDVPDEGTNASGRMGWASMFANLLLFLGALVAIEAALRLAGYGEQIRYSVWQPGLGSQIIPDERDTPGISEPHQFKITSLGYRGRPIGSAALRIAAFGGSTTEAIFVPEERTWPRVVEAGLSQKLRSEVWVGNFGRSGRNTRQHLLDAKYVLPQFPIQIALFLVGVNDLGLFFSEPRPQPMPVDDIISDKYLRDALVVQKAETDSIKLIALAQALGHRFNALSEKKVSSDLVPYVTVDFYRKYRKVRAERSGFVAEMPDLAPMLDEYGRNLALIADLVRERGVLPIFMTQSSLWSPNVPRDLDALFWSGAAGHFPSDKSGLPYYSPEMLERMMAGYNERTRLIAQRKDVPLIDIAAMLPKDRVHFYDEMHYNEAGSRAVAELIIRELMPIIKNGTRHDKRLGPGPS